MNARRKRSGPSVVLPWERHGAMLGGVGTARRVRTVLLVLFGLGGAVAAFEVADQRARVRSTRAGIAEVQRAVAAFRAEVGRCPRSSTELVHPPRAGAKYLDEIPQDGWGHELYVRCPGRRAGGDADVISAGPSGSLLEDDNIL